RDAAGIRTRRTCVRRKSSKGSIVCGRVVCAVLGRACQQPSVQFGGIPRNIWRSAPRSIPPLGGSEAPTFQSFVTRTTPTVVGFYGGLSLSVNPQYRRCHTSAQIGPLPGGLDSHSGTTVDTRQPLSL